MPTCLSTKTMQELPPKTLIIRVVLYRFTLQLADFHVIFPLHSFTCVDAQIEVVSIYLDKLR